MATPPQGSSSNHLHYGGGFTRKGGASSLPNGRKFKTQKRLETIVRLENAGFTVGQIAPMIMISQKRVQQIIRSTDYLNARIRITHGIIIDHESTLSQIKEQRKEILTQLLPPALQALANEIQAPAVTLMERKHKHAVITDLLDREGSFAKISRAEIKDVDHFDFEAADAQSRSLINAVRSVASPPTGKTEEIRKAIAQNVAFSQSHTLSSIDQQEALKALEEAAESGEIDPEMLEVLPTQNELKN